MVREAFCYNYCMGGESVDSVLLNQEAGVLSKEEIRQRLHLYHGTTPGKWRAIQEVGVILSESELIRRGVLSPGDLENVDSTSTGELDRRIGNDRFVFLSVYDENYGDLVLEVDPKILEIPGVVVNTAGDYLNFVGDPELEEYYAISQIQAPHFLDYLVQYVNGLPDPDWFFGKRDEALGRLVREALLERNVGGKTEKFKLYWSLFAEIKVPREVPLNYVVAVRNYST